MPPLFGEIAALITAICWSITPIIFAKAGKQIGALAINRLRLIISLIFYFTLHTILFHNPIPLGIPLETWLWLGGSGLVGLVVGDSFYYRALIEIGPRRSILLMSTAPIVAAVLAWMFLGQNLSWLQWVGIFTTVGGVLWVMGKQPDGVADKKARGQYLRGSLFALGGAVGQAIGLILARKGMSPDLPTLSVTLIRMLAATGAFWIVLLFRGQIGMTLAKLKLPSLSQKMFAGSFIGPFLGVFFSMVAITWAPVGIASTLMSLSPIIMIPLASRYFADRAGLRGVSGAILAVIGSAILILT
ncbi:DMT family transporter [bacterium]|nr:DMT family transporter [bacterium]